MTTNWWNVESAFYAGTPGLVKLLGPACVWLVAAIWLACLVRCVARNYAVLLAAGCPVARHTLWRALAGPTGEPSATASWRASVHVPWFAIGPTMRLSGGLLLAGGVWLLLFISWPGKAFPWLPVAGLCLVCLAAAIDARTGYLPDALTWPVLGLGIAHAWFAGGYPSPMQALVGAATGYALPWFVSQCYALWRGRAGLGGGDIKLLAALGAWLGPAQVAWVLLLACLLAILWACGAAIRWRMPWQRQQARPFGPPLVVAGVGVFVLQSALQCQFSVCFSAYVVRACTKLVLPAA